MHPKSLNNGQGKDRPNMLTFLFQACFQCYEIFIEDKINLRIINLKKLFQFTSIYRICKSIFLKVSISDTILIFKIYTAILTEAGREYKQHPTVLYNPLLQDTITHENSVFRMHELNITNSSLQTVVAT